MVIVSKQEHIISKIVIKHLWKGCQIFYEPACQIKILIVFYFAKNLRSLFLNLKIPKSMAWIIKNKVECIAKRE